MASITKLIFEHHPADGFVNSSKYRLTERDFRFYYQLYVADEVSSYRLKIKGLDGEIRELTLTGETYEALEAIDSPVPEEAVLKLEHKEEYSYMQIGIFENSYLEDAGLNYEEFLENSFSDLKRKKVKNLVLDLRGNGGGDDAYGALLVTYFASNPFMYFDRIEVTDDYSGYGKVRHSRGRNLMTSHPVQKLWKPKKYRFKGKLYVLTDGWSFSTCADVATILHDSKRATFIGEETGGGYEGNTSGISETLRLRNSDITLSLPMWMYTTATGRHDCHGRGVIPDHPVIPSVQEFINGEDAVLKKVESLIKK